MVKITTNPTHDIYAPGLIRGKHSFLHNPKKKVFFVEHPTEGWRVFLRAVCFIHEEGNDDMTKFIVAKKSGTDPVENVWEAPKGQMEAKDGLAHPRWPIMKILKENIIRECEEEVKIGKFVSLEPLPGFIIESQEEEYPENYFFQYQVFRGIVKKKVLEDANEIFAYYKEHPKAFARLSHDNNEKDDIAWYSPRKTKMMGRWSPTLTKMYLKYIKQSP
jgi:8-oxo-dGTP pyrophosphatase MutT (NUDIX family)